MIRGGHEAWRYTLLSGLIPAIPLLLVRPFLPESPLWRERKSTSRLERPRLSELFQPALRKTTLVATFLFACSWALPLGAIQHTVRMASGLAEVQNLPPRADRANLQWGAIVPGTGGWNRPHTLCSSYHSCRFTTPARALFLRSVSDRLSLSVLFRGNSHFGSSPPGNFSCHHAFQRTT
jgi:hypothetical protein